MKIRYAGRSVAVMALALMMVTGCQSKQDAAIEAAKKPAAAPGQPPQGVTGDKKGNTTTTTVKPPSPGQTAQAVTTTVVPATAPAGQPAVVPGQPAVAPGQPAVAGGQPNGAAQPVQEATPGGNPVVHPADVNVPAGTT